MGDIIRARVFFERTLYGKIKRALYKEEELFIEYLFEQGEIRRHRVIPDNAQSGIWVNPYVSEKQFINDSESSRPQAKSWGVGKTVAAVKFIRKEPESFSDNFPLEWERIVRNH